MDFKALLALMVQKKASDLFITAERAPTMKVDGLLIEVSKTSLSAEQSLKVVQSIMNQRQRTEFENTKECQFAITLPDLGRFRVSAFTQRDAAGMVLRRIESEIPDADALNLPPILKSLIMEKRGLIIFVGGTGAGKSSSLAALIKHRNMNSSGHIITIEDPIEFVHSPLQSMVTQREVGVHTPSFPSAIRAALREDPDVILVGEMRDLETIASAITLAETGH